MRRKNGKTQFLVEFSNGILHTTLKQEMTKFIMLRTHAVNYINGFRPVRAVHNTHVLSIIANGILSLYFCVFPDANTMVL